MALTVMEEAYCQGIAKHGRKAKVLAYTEAGYSTSMSKNALGVCADRIYNRAKVSLRIDELMKVIEKVAKEKFTISVEWRLNALKNIHDAGMTQYEDANEKKRYENLAASNAAVKTMNEMLGTDEKADRVKPVKVFIGVQDASKS